MSRTTDPQHTTTRRQRRLPFRRGASGAGALTTLAVLLAVIGPTAPAEAAKASTTTRIGRVVTAPASTAEKRTVQIDLSQNWVNDYALVSTKTCTPAAKNPSGRRDVGTLVGGYPVLATSDKDWKRDTGTGGLVGYPGDKPSATMWSAIGWTDGPNGATAGWIDGQIAGGYSGAGAFRTDARGTLCLVGVAIRSEGAYSGDHGVTGHTMIRRFTVPMVADLTAWKKAIA